MHKVKGIRESIGAMLLWGSAFFLYGIITKEMTFLGFFSEKTNLPSHYIFSGAIISTLALTYTVIKKSRIKKQDFKGVIVVLLGVSMLLNTLAWFTVNYGISEGFISLVIPISSVYPAIVAGLGVIIYKERLVKNQYLGLGFILLGLVLVSI